MSDCLFCRIVRGEIPSKKIYEDEDIFVFHDINPARPVHFLMVPKKHIDSLKEVEAGDERVLGRLLLKAHELAAGQGLHDGFKTLINTGRMGGQEVYHLHLHVLGGPKPTGPMPSRDA